MDGNIGQSVSQQHVSTTIGWIAIEFGTDIPVSLGMMSNNLSLIIPYPFTFNLVPPFHQE